MAIKNLKRTKRVENKRIIGLDGTALDDTGSTEITTPRYVRTEFSLSALDVGSFADYKFVRTQTTLSAVEV